MTEITTASPARAPVNLDRPMVPGEAHSTHASTMVPSAFPNRPLSSNASWTNITTSVAPAPSYGMTMTYDAADGYLLEYGGYASWSNSTWIFQNGNWVNISESVGPNPGALSFPTMTYDPAVGHVLLVGGGQRGAGQALPLWEFSNDHWSLLHPSCTGGGAYNFSCPAVTDDVPMAYDEKDNYLVVGDSNVNGQYCTFTFANNTWTGLPAMWTNNNTTRPCPMGGGGSTSSTEPGSTSMAYDQADQEIVFYTSNSTWTFTGGNWTDVTAKVGTSPVSQIYPQLAYDVSGGYILLYGGRCSHGPPGGGCEGYEALNGTWEFKGGHWYNVTGEPSPGPRFYGAIAYDQSSGDIILFGGTTDQGGDFILVNNTWSWGVGSSISGLAISANPASPLPGVPASFSESFVGGLPPISYVWHFGDGTTSDIANPSHAFATIGYYNVSLWVNDSASHSAFASLLIHVYVPLATPQVAASPNPALFGVPVNFTSTESGGTTPYTYAWAFGDGGTGGNLQNITHAYTTNGPFMVVLTVTDAVGGVAHGYLNITIQLQATAQANVTAGIAPLAVGFSSIVRGGTPGYTYSWSFGDGGTSTASSPSHVFVSPDTYPVELQVVDSVGHVATSYLNETVTQGGIPLAISLKAVPSSLTVGNSSVVTASPSGGHGSYTVAWPNIPSWCTLVTSLSLKCTPVAAGTYKLNVSVTDATDTTASNSTTLTVSGKIVPLAIIISVQPGNMTVGSPFVLTAVPSGGQPPYVVSWPGLPAWCSAVSSVAVKCIPPSQGTFTFTATVVDSAGKTATTSIGFVASCPVAGCPGTHQQPTFLGLPGNLGYYLLLGVVCAAVLLVAVGYNFVGSRPPTEAEPEGPDAFAGFKKTTPEELDKEPAEFLAEGQTDPAEDLF